ncbi:MAG: hypothetical protein QG585_419 [Patescibacteria group bacterium]|jgi:UDPglucose 6-dehydrogenase|nr:hypothetical protein [Patescibacteria group bacterium]
MEKEKNDLKIGFVGQGWIGKNYADDFEMRGYKIVRYSLDAEFKDNKDKIKNCDFVVIAVPTPTTPEGFDYSAVEEALMLVGSKKIAVIKSTVLPGTTIELQKKFGDIYILFSPEFLSTATAAFDASHPNRNVVGVPIEDAEYEERAKFVMMHLPQAQYEKICSSTEAEMIKYVRNCIGYSRILMANIFFDLSVSLGANYEVIKEAVGADPDFGPTYTSAVHKTGRGAGGLCFIKDFAALRKFYEETVLDPKGVDMLKAIESKNIELLKNSNKDLDLLQSVYGN